MTIKIIEKEVVKERTDIAGVSFKNPCHRALMASKKRSGVILSKAPFTLCGIPLCEIASYHTYNGIKGQPCINPDGHSECSICFRH